METLNHQGICLEYEITGEGIPFVFLHGMGGGIHQINSTYVPIEGVRLINMNQQGHGNSGADWEHYDFDHLADDVAALLDHLKIQKAYFAGISMGAAVALNFAVRFPERVKGLLLIRNAWLDQPMASNRIRAYADMGKCLKEKKIDLFYQTVGWQLVKEPSAYTRNAFTCTFGEEQNLKNWQKFLILPKEQPIPDMEVLKNLTMPVYIVANRNDFCHPFEYGTFLHLLIPHSEFYEVSDKDKDGAGHKLQINQVIFRMLKEEDCKVEALAGE